MPPCRQQFGEILYSAKADPVPNIAHPTFAFRSCLGFILIFECPGELDIIICGWRSTIFFLSLIPATVPPSVINDLCWIESFWWWRREKEGETWEVSCAAASERMPLARSLNMIEIMNKIIDELMNESMARRGKMAGKTRNRWSKEDSRRMSLERNRRLVGQSHFLQLISNGFLCQFDISDWFSREQMLPLHCRYMLSSSRSAGLSHALPHSGLH